MDEVEHRRRRTRTARNGDPTVTSVPPSEVAPAAAPGVPVDSPAPPYRPRATPVTPADIADRSTPDPAHEHHAGVDHHAVHPVHDDREGERGLRGLVGGGSTQVSVTAAMRARDAARPTGSDIANAEANLTIVHRGWVPRE